MRQAIGSTWIMQLVIIFMLIFVAFLSLTINFTKAFKIKNEMISMIEKYEGLGSGENSALTLINNYLKYNNYGVLGSCENDEYGVLSLDTGSMEMARSGEKYYYCVQKEDTSLLGLPDRARYHVRIFFHFSLPIIGDIFTFSSEGTTIDISHSISDIEFV